MAKARILATKKATEVLPELISDAIEAGIHANNVLFDSWFSSPKVVRSMRELGLDVASMVKKSSKIHYRFQGQMCSYKDIFQSCKHRCGRSRYLFLAVGIREDSDQRTAGPLFCLVSEELADISVAAAFEKLHLFLQKLLEGFITRKEEICVLVIDLWATLPEDMRRFLDFEGVKCISTT